MTLRLVLFDCDGTLVDSAAVIVRAMTAAFTRHDLAAPDERTIRGIIGLSLPLAISELCRDRPDAPVVDLCDAYTRAYRDAAVGVEAEPVFPGTLAALDALAGEATLLGIVTGKSRAGLARVLAAHDLAGRFAVTRTADEAPSKPAPDMVLQALAATGADAGRTVVIGDTDYDMLMAKAAGAHAIGVTWGNHEPDRLSAAGADALVEEMGALPRCIDEIVHG